MEGIQRYSQGEARLLIPAGYMSKLKQQRRLLSDSSGFNYGASAPLPESPAVRT